MLAMLVSMFTVMAFAVSIAECTCPHDPEHPAACDELVEAVTATCVDKGTPAYYHCKTCGGYFWGQFTGANARTYNPKTMTSNTYTTDPNNHKTLDTVEEEPATCAADGVKAHKKCKDCGAKFQMDGATPATEEWLKIDKLTTHTTPLVYHKANAARCDAEGNLEYWECSTCHKLFSDAEGTTETDLNAVTIAKTEHTWEKIGLSADGKKDLYECKVCHKKEERDPQVATYKLTVDNNYGYVKINDETKYELTGIKKGDKVKVKAFDPSKYTFSYWKVVSGDLTLSYEKYSREMTFTMPAGDVKLEAIYTRDSSSTHSHSYKYVKYNDTYHWKECRDCSYEVKEEHTWIKNTGSDKSRYPYICKYCDQKSTDDRTHNFKYTEIDSTYHWADCKDCSYSVKEKHTWIRNTSKSTKDEYAYVCEYCGRLSNRLNDLPFHDVSDSYWYYDDVLYAYLNGLMDGVSITSFGADQNTTRGQIVTILWRLTGEPRATRDNRFTDVSSKSYYNNAISWAAEAGIVDGFDAKTFKPEANVTREQLAAILYRYAEYMNLSTKGASNLTKFDDYYQIGTWAREAMAWANYHGLIEGVGYSRIDPKGLATRAQVAAILHRFAVEFA